MGGYAIYGDYEHQSGQHDRFRALTKAEFDVLLKKLVRIGGSFQVNAEIEYKERW